MQRRIVVIDPGFEIDDAFRALSQRKDHFVIMAPDGRSGLRMIQDDEPDAVILELDVPDMRGLDLLKAVRRVTNAPIMVVTANGGEANTVLSLRLGADAFVTKPCGSRELIARLSALFRRFGTTHAEALANNAGRLRFGVVDVDLVREGVRRNGRRVRLRPLEQALLFALIAHRGCVMSRETLWRDVWRREDPPSRTLDVHIAGLRRKLEDDAADPQFIRTSHTLGYWWAAELTGR